MNETLFFLQIFVLGLATLLATRFGYYALVALGSSQMLFCNLFISKQVALFGLSVTASDAYAITLFLINNLIITYYGKQKAKEAIKIHMLSLLLFTLLVKIHLLLTPSSFDSMHHAYHTIFDQSSRVTISSIICFYLTQKLDFLIFTSLIKRLSSLSSMFISLTITQAFDTLIFTTLAFWGLNIAFLEILLFSFLMKIISISLMSPLTIICKRHIKKEAL